MGTQWFLNMAGKQLTEEHMGEIPHVNTELTVHVTYKTVQAFSILAIGAAPIAAVVQGNRSLAGVRDTALRFGPRGALIGLVLGPIATYAKLRSCDHAGVYDRCYRLRYNRHQVRVDRIASVGLFGGLASALFMGSNAVAGAAVLGMSGGVFVAALYNAFVVGDKHK